MGQPVERILYPPAVFSKKHLCCQDLVDAESPGRPVTVPVSLTQEQIAAMAGSCQQTISEALKKLQDDGLIQVSRKGITLPKPLE